MGALIVGGDFEGTAGSGRILAEDESDVHALQSLLLLVATLLGLERGRQVEKTVPLADIEVEFLGHAHTAYTQTCGR